MDGFDRLDVCIVKTEVSGHQESLINEQIYLIVKTLLCPISWYGHLISLWVPEFLNKHGTTPMLVWTVNFKPGRTLPW